MYFDMDAFGSSLSSISFNLFIRDLVRIFFKSVHKQLDGDRTTLVQELSIMERARVFDGTCRHPGLFTCSDQR